MIYAVRVTPHGRSAKTAGIISSWTRSDWPRKPMPYHFMIDANSDEEAGRKVVFLLNQPRPISGLNYIRHCRMPAR